MGHHSLCSLQQVNILIMDGVRKFIIKRRCSPSPTDYRNSCKRIANNILSSLAFKLGLINRTRLSPSCGRYRCRMCQLFPCCSLHHRTDLLEQMSGIFHQNHHMEIKRRLIENIASAAQEVSAELLEKRVENCAEHQSMQRIVAPGPVQND